MLAASLFDRAVIPTLCVAVVVVSLVAWSRTRPPVLISSALPPVLRRAVLWWLGLTGAFAGAALIWLVARGPLGLPRQGVYRFVPLALALAPLLVVNPLYLWRTAWIRRAAAESDGRLCTHCTYNLTGLSSAGRCPECGQPYDIEADAPLWQGRALRRDTQAAPGAAVGGDERDGDP